jgi:hypothetical protein
MGVWEIMELDRSLRAMKKKLKKSIDPSIDRSRLDESIDFAAARSTNAGKLQIDRKDIEGCRDCPEGMQW